MTPIFDTHAHYDDSVFDEDREELLSGLPKHNIAKVVNVGAHLEACKKARALAETHDYVFCTAGIHPSDVGRLTQEDLVWLGEQCRYEKCVAVGETGLDYHEEDPAPAIQKEWFVRQLALARELSMPVIIHSRDAAKDTIDIMTAEHAGDLGGVVHCYSYTKETAKIFLDMGFYFGIGGVLTFKNAKKLKEAVEYIPMERIVLETDAPYLAPEPYRGQRNSSLNIPYVVAAMAEIKGISEEEVRAAAWENSHRLYRLPL